ncbi:MAG: hydroxyacylglutathione hydrolase [Francisellaceae bacterium]
MTTVKRWYLNNALRNYNYVLLNEKNKKCLIFDPTMAEHFIEFMTEKGLQLEAILLTHEHGDHVAGVDKLVRKYGCPVYGSFDKAGRCVIGHIVHDDERLNFATADCRVLTTPGHTAAHVCYYFETDELLFCGDTIFTAGVGNAKQQSGDVVALYRSIQRLRELPDATKIFPAHDYFENNLKFAMQVDDSHLEYSRWFEKVDGVKAEDKPITTIGDERQMNVFFHADEHRLVEAIARAGDTVETGVEAFKYLRAQKDAF